jgi:hypothetical protein
LPHFIDLAGKKLDIVSCANYTHCCPCNAHTTY